MPPNDSARLGLADVASALMLLTRLPVPHSAPSRPQGVWAWPVAGLIVAIIASSIAATAHFAGLPAAPSAALLLTLQAILTGGLHEDGLADSADGLLGGRDKARRLEIMKDSRIGSHGALALGLILLLRWSSLSVIIATDHFGAILAAAVISRSAMAGLIATLPNARGSGLSQSMGAVPHDAALFSAALALALGFVTAGLTALPMALAAGLIALMFAAYAKSKIGGQTGDILGATQQLTEAAMLMVAASLP